MGVIKTSFSALNMYNTCLFVNYTLIKLKKELKEKACEWLNKWYYHETFILTSHWNMQQLDECTFTEISYSQKVTYHMILCVKHYWNDKTIEMGTA